MSIFSFIFHFSMKIMSANRIAPDGTPHFAASHLGLFCLPMFHKKDVRLIGVKDLNMLNARTGLVHMQFCWFCHDVAC